MAYRKFWLINSLGERYDFADPDKKENVFLNNPEGLGFQRAYTSLVVGNSELVTSQQFQLTDFKGSLVFYNGNNGTRYQAYFDFLKFAKYKPLELHYLTPNELKSYHCDVLFIQADKTEVKTGDVLTIPVTFHRLTEWLTDDDVVYELNNSPTGNGKKYDLAYNYSYSGSSLADSVLTNNGTDDIGFVITVEGEVQNLQFTLSQNGETYGVCKINGTYDFVQIDSVERTESIYLESNGSVVTNPEQYQDFTIRNGASYLTWLKLKVGESHFAFTCGNIDTFDGTVTISFKESYVSV